jgi:hypothetical protein
MPNWTNASKHDTTEVLTIVNSNCKWSEMKGNYEWKDSYLSPLAVEAAFYK